jgi:GNAT superfamily N-acetyltransferase
LNPIVRPAQPSDALAVATVHVRAWQVGYRDLLPHTYLEQLRPEQRAARYRFGDDDPHAPQTLLACDGACVLGFTTTVFEGAHAPAELGALYVDPDCWERGIGGVLIAAARERLRASGAQEAIAWLLAGNTRALRFYQSDGWRDDATRREDTVWGLRVAEWRLLRTL